MTHKTPYDWHRARRGTSPTADSKAVPLDRSSGGEREARKTERVITGSTADRCPSRPRCNTGRTTSTRLKAANGFDRTPTSPRFRRSGGMPTKRETPPRGGVAWYGFGCAGAMRPLANGLLQVFSVNLAAS